MSSILKSLEKRVEEKIGPLADKLDEMGKRLDKMIQLLEQIEKNTQH